MHIDLPILKEEHTFVVETARNFSQKYLLPEVVERDNEQRFPKSEIAQMAKLGFMGMMVSPKYEGSGMNTVAYALALIEISKIDASAAVCMSVNNSLVCWGMEVYGTEEQKKKYLRPLAKGDILGAFCLSEPESGSDSTAQRTTASLEGDYYLLNGTKNWITNGDSASVYLVIAQSDASKKHKGINAFIVERSWQGVRVGKKEDKMGIRGSDTHSIMFSDVKIPKENLLGKDGEGFRIAMETLDGGRIGIAAQATGIAEGAYETSSCLTQKSVRPLVGLFVSYKLFNLS